jgi:3-hydroxyisobutyrate dehydrogenase-like beta-hydroxyacid dehydrogenase
MKLAFVGLGQMGRHMAANLLRSDTDLIAVNRSPDAFPPLQAKGARTSTAIGDTVDADIIFLCLPSAEVVTAALLGEAGIADKLKPGQLVVDTSTITYGATLEIAKALAGRGIAFLDAPVSGMEARARDATLTIMCGGAPEAFEKVEPYLGRMGNNVLYMGAVGSGQLTKLINQLLFDINAAALAEILPMAMKMGLDPEKVASVVNSGTGRSYASEFFIPRVLEENFADGYPMKSAYKDLVSAAEIGAGLCIPMPVLAAATVTYQLALLRGHGGKDKGGMIQVFEELLGVRFRKTAAPGGAPVDS